MAIILFYIFIFIFGLIIGSFLNAVIWRLYKKESLWKKLRSYCIHCRHPLGLWDLFPLFSFSLLKGKCRYCKKKISWQYPLVELVTALLFLLAALKQFYGLPIEEILMTDLQIWLILLRDWVFISFLTVIFVYDLKYYLILDKITIPAMIVAVILNLLLTVDWWTLWLFKMILGALVAGGFFMLQIIVSKGKWVGGGDVRLGFLMGLMLAWPAVLLALFIAYVSGAIISLLLVVAKTKTFKSQVPFGTFLAVATVITLLYGDQIISWYLGLLR